MGNKIKFVRNYSDLCTDRGFQFEFYCDRCGTGYRTRFKASKTGAMSDILDTAGSLFGGIFRSADNISDKVHSATWEKAHDNAFAETVEEMKDDFVQCPKCSQWVCIEQCWNETRGLCKECAPDLGVEMSAAQARKTVSSVWEHAEVAEEDQYIEKKETWNQVIKATCPECGLKLNNKPKFCPECGTKINTVTFCSECGAKMAPGAKFCSECGNKME